MNKSNTDSEKAFPNNNENVKTIERLPQIKISDLSIILYLHHRSEFTIRQYTNVKSCKCIVKHWKKMIKRHHK